MRALKVLVLAMGLFILLGVALLAYGLLAGVGKQEQHAEKAGELLQIPVASGPGFGTVSLDEGPEAVLMQATLAGSVLLVRVGGGGADRLHVIDTSSGRRLGKIVLRADHTTAPE
ncbi:hypothetical protein HEQ62_02025 [Haematospirillum jordaniae]|nr:hypothetical protein [Haematospirillum jordaniae]NKD44125.1 hypothetical protein [Haematospirillum jordaniae]NKD56503.1 hypothetical protein [Haematospirillum jordaniae]NKD58561.1 hypothetical protein [Haematospirillum jordaniae]NKD66270.1 hypothetical protein [Haematospirillum jordaniae]NKD78563.1 hypothetical protein [Haematospirillum jordaniae]